MSAARVDCDGRPPGTSSGADIVYGVGVSPEADGAGVAALLEEFSLDEPAMAPLRLDVAALRPVMLPYALALLQYPDMCVTARAGDGRRLVGIALNFHEAPPYADKDDGWLGSFLPNEAVLAHQRFVRELDDRVDLCERYAVDSLFVVDTLVCSRAYRRLGVARRLVELSLDVAARRGYRAAAAFGSSAHSQRIFDGLGFERVAEARATEHPNAALFSADHIAEHSRFVVYGRRLAAAGCDAPERSAVAAAGAAAGSGVETATLGGRHSGEPFSGFENLPTTSVDASTDAERIAYEDGASLADADALADLLEVYVRDEPCMGSLLLDPDRLKAAMPPFAREVLHFADLCVVARLGARIVGAAFNFRIEPGQPDDLGWLGSFYPLAELLAHERCVMDLCDRADVCARYGGVPEFLVGMVVCARDLRGRGVAGGLVRRSLALAASRGYRLAATTATNAYTKRTFERAGFEAVAETMYDDHPNAALFSEAHKRLHRSMVVYAKRLPDAADAAAWRAPTSGDCE